MAKFKGSARGNRFVGTSVKDRIDGRGGDDTFFGLGGDDKIKGGNGDDLLDGGAGDDDLKGGNGNDTLLGGTGDDKLDAGDGADLINAGAGDNKVKAGDGDDIVTAGNGDNRIDTGKGNDRIVLGAGKNDITTGAGDDTVFAGGGDNKIDTGKGSDAVTAAAGDDAIDLGDGHDLAHSGAGDDRVEGGGGSDTIFGGAGRDRIFGDGSGSGSGSGSGQGVDDYLDGGADDDWIVGGAGADTVLGGAGNDVLFGDAGGSGKAWYKGSGGFGGSGSGSGSAFGSGSGSGSGGFDDYLDGGAGNDIVIAAGGDDEARYTMAQNIGAIDRYHGGMGIDTLTLAFTANEWRQAQVQADIAAYLDFLDNSTGRRGEATTKPFAFTAFDLSARAFEILRVQVDGVARDPADEMVTALDDVASVTEGDGITGFASVLSNDSVPDLIDTVALVTGVGPNAGRLVFNAGTPGASDGSFSFDPGTDFEDLGAGETREVTFTYRITDVDGDSDEATVAIVVTGTNDAPTISAHAPKGFIEAMDGAAQTLSQSGMVSFDDIDATDGVDVGFVSNGDISWSNGTLDAGLEAALIAGFNTGATGVEAPGTTPWAFDATGLNLDFLAEAETITWSYTLRATDSTGAVAQTPVSFLITGTDDTPQITLIPSDSAQESLQEMDARLRVSSTLTFVDADLHDTVRASGIGVSVAGVPDLGASPGQADLLAMFSIESDPVLRGDETLARHEWSFDSGTDSFDFLAVGDTLALSYTVQASDGNGPTATRDVTITLAGTNDAPTLMPGAGNAVEDGGAIKLDLATLGDDIDRDDDGSTLSYAVLGQPGEGSARMDGTTIIFDPGTGFQDLGTGDTRDVPITITATDAHGATAIAHLTVTVTGVNDLVDGDETATVLEPTVVIDRPAEVNPRTARTDPWQIETSADAPAQPILDSGGLVPPEQAVTPLPNLLDNTVDPEPGAPVVSAVNGVTANVGTPRPGDNGGVFVINADGSARFSAGASFETLSEGEHATTSITYTVKDAEGAEVPSTVAVTVTGTNDAPDITPTALAAVKGGQPVTVDLATRTDDVDSEDDGTTLAYEITGAPAYGAATLQGTVLSFDPGADLEGLAQGETREVTIEITATDTRGAQDVESILVAVTGTNTAPRITLTPFDTDTQTLNETNAGLSVSSTLTFFDADISDTVTAVPSAVTVAGDTAGFPQITNADLLAMFSIDVDPVLTDVETLARRGWTFDSGPEAFDGLAEHDTLDLTYTLVATDSAGDVATKDVMITIRGTNDAPLAAVDTNTVTEAGIGRVGESMATGNVIDNDTDVDNGAVLRLDPAFGAVVSGIYGSLDFDLDGAYTYRLSNNRAVTQGLREDEVAHDVFRYVVVDEYGASDETTLRMEVIGSNDAPAITVGASDSAGAMLYEVDDRLSATGTLSVADRDTGDTVNAMVASVAVSGDTAGAPGMAALLSLFDVTPAAVIDAGETEGSLAWEFASGSDTFDFLDAGETLVLDYEIVASDTRADDTKTVRIQIDGAEVTVTPASNLDAAIATGGPFEPSPLEAVLQSNDFVMPVFADLG